LSEVYLCVKAIHISSAMLLFGTGLGTAFQMWFAHRTGEPKVIAAVARNVVLADWLFTLPSGIVQPITGVVLSTMVGFSLLSGWLLLTMALYLRAFACWLPVVFLQIRMRDLAIEAAATNTALPAAYHRAAHWWFALGWPAFFAMVAIVVLMVRKPAL
jgi:uncharacterized membrane protein